MNIRTIDIEEDGDETCPNHLWHVYIDGDTPKYRECQRCWKLQRKCPGDSQWHDARTF